MNTYIHLAAHDLVEAVEAIPNPAMIIAQQQRATGTDGGVVPNHRAVAPPVARTESEKSAGKNAQRQSHKEFSRNRGPVGCASGNPTNKITSENKKSLCDCTGFIKRRARDSKQGLHQVIA
jgi:hypothetical protein